MGFFPPGRKGVHNAGDVVRREFVVVRHLDALFGGVNKQCFAVGLVLLAPGIPQVYYVGMLAGKNDIKLLEETKEGRNINRH